MNVFPRKAALLRLTVLLAVAGALGWFALHPPDLLQSLLGAKSIAGIMDKLRRERPDVVQLASGINRDLTLAAFKREQVLEMWSGGRLLKSYPFTKFSGQLGPKVKEGDGQVPEGVYAAKSLNPNSRFHLSIEVGYPNVLELEAAKKEGRDNLGGEIFIHGGRSSVGCIPIGDPAIEEVFFAVAQAGLAHTRIVIAPYDRRKGKDREVEAEVFKATPWAEAAYGEIDRALADLKP